MDFAVVTLWKRRECHYVTKVIFKIFHQFWMSVFIGGDHTVDDADRIMGVSGSQYIIEISEWLFE